MMPTMGLPSDLAFWAYSRQLSIMSSDDISSPSVYCADGDPQQHSLISVLSSAYVVCQIYGSFRGFSPEPLPRALFTCVRGRGYRVDAGYPEQAVVTCAHVLNRADARHADVIPVWANENRGGRLAHNVYPVSAVDGESVRVDVCDLARGSHEKPDVIQPRAARCAPLAGAGGAGS